MANSYKNPANAYVEQISPMSWLWCLAFGTIYFAYKGVWTHVFVSLLLAPMTLGLSWLVYPFFARSIIENAYLKKGWIGVEGGVGRSNAEIVQTLRQLSTAVLVSLVIATTLSVVFRFLDDAAFLAILDQSIQWLLAGIGIVGSVILFNRRSYFSRGSKYVLLMVKVQLVSALIRTLTSFVLFCYVQVWNLFPTFNVASLHAVLPWLAFPWAISTLLLIITSAIITYWLYRHHDQLTLTSRTH